jgi:glutathione gamma-glutamylcysteinyltransferase
VVSFSRGAFGQSGDGHFSPIGAYDPATDMALVLDVARFKYLPFWVPVPLLFRAMVVLDGATGQSRGWLEVRRRAADAPAAGAHAAAAA